MLREVGQQGLHGEPGIIRIYDLANLETSLEDLHPEEWQELRRKAQERVMQKVPLEFLGKYRNGEAKAMIRSQVLQCIELEKPGLSLHARSAMVERLTNDISGYGPLEALLDDPTVTEIIAERYDKVLIERNGELSASDVRFDSEEHLRLVIERIIAPLGRRLDWSSPTVDARMPDGSRICAVIPPVSPDGATLSIRKFKPNVSMRQLVDWAMLPLELMEGLRACVQGRLNILISGGTGSGKSTFLNALSEFMDPRLSLITIENPIELQLRHPNVRRWEARSANLEGQGEVNMMSLVIVALRSRPDVIIVGEVRGKEAYALLQAMNTGHLGSMSTLHANNPAQAMERLVAMVASAGELPRDLVPAYIGETVDLIVHVMRMADGKRRVTEVAEVLGEAQGRILTRSLVVFRTDRFEQGLLEGHWELTGEEFGRRELLLERGVVFPGWLGEKRGNEPSKAM